MFLSPNLEANRDTGKFVARRHMQPRSNFDGLPPTHPSSKGYGGGGQRKPGLIALASQRSSPPENKLSLINRINTMLPKLDTLFSGLSYMNNGNVANTLDDFTQYLIEHNQNSAKDLKTSGFNFQLTEADGSKNLVLKSERPDDSLIEFKASINDDGNTTSVHFIENNLELVVHYGDDADVEWRTPQIKLDDGDIDIYSCLETLGHRLNLIHHIIEDKPKSLLEHGSDLANTLGAIANLIDKTGLAKSQKPNEDPITIGNIEYHFNHKTRDLDGNQSRSYTVQVRNSKKLNQETKLKFTLDDFNNIEDFKFEAENKHLYTPINDTSRLVLDDYSQLPNARYQIAI